MGFGLLTAPSLKRNFLDEMSLNSIEKEITNLQKHGEFMMKSLSQRNESLVSYYREKGYGSLIVVPEVNKKVICRIEFLCGMSKILNDIVDLYIKPILEKETGEKLVLFKDKCNLKLPGGGAFGPHQDYPAYAAFPPKNYITAMVPLDECDEENGCLSIADPSEVIMIEKERFILPMNDLGEIVPNALEQLTWKQYPMERGDVLIFDSFVPHKSNPNMSERTRRVLYFTFCLFKDGNYYQSYYEKKWNDYGNPLFHIATPTARN